MTSNDFLNWVWFVPFRPLFTIMGDPFDFGGSEHYAQGKDWSKMIFKVFFLDLMAFPMHINVRLETFSKISI